MKIFSFFFILMHCTLFAIEVSDLTLEEKVGQLLMVHFNGLDSNQESDRLICEAHVGGFIYYKWANGLVGPEQVKNLSAGLQASSKIPLLIAVDQEGGRVSRLTDGFTQFPSNFVVAKTGDPDYAREIAFVMGQEMRDVGVNMNFAPVVDVNINPYNPIIGDRSFGTDPSLVATFGAKSLEGYKQANVIATLKHFPGHGDVTVDSHKGIPIVNKNKSELVDVEWFPFQQLINEAPVIMTAHLIESALDPHQIATFSPLVVDKLLRQEMDFKGVIITDSLVMKGVSLSSSSIQEAALRALQAGHDMLLLGGGQLLGSSHELSVDDVMEIHHSLVEAVKEKKLSEERINQSVERILNLKDVYRVNS
jgi:beta-N-acetylhexosaminidase